MLNASGFRSSVAISTLAEGYRWSALAIAGALLAIAGLVIALGSRRSAMVRPVAD